MAARTSPERDPHVDRWASIRKWMPLWVPLIGLVMAVLTYFIFLTVITPPGI